jgi:hypothetical protein
MNIAGFDNGEIERERERERERGWMQQTNHLTEAWRVCK